MASATHRALARRASLAAKTMEFWCERIEKEIANQNVKRIPRENETVTLKAATVTVMLSDVHQLIDKIHEFERNLASERIWARRRPSS